MDEQLSLEEFSLVYLYHIINWKNNGHVQMQIDTDQWVPNYATEDKKE